MKNCIQAFASLVVSASLLIPSSVIAAAPPEPLHGYSFITNIPEDYSAWWKMIWSKESLPITLGVLGATGAMVPIDYEMYQWVRQPYQKHDDFKKFCDSGEEASKLYLQAGMLAGFTFAGAFTQNQRALRTASQLFEAYLSSGLVVQVIKHTTGRESPVSATTRTGKWNWFPNQRQYMKDYQSYDAMPSGHLSSVAVLYFVIEKNYPEQRWIPYVGYPAMAWSAIGLVGTGIHWWSDFPLAIAISYSFASTVTRNNPEQLQKKESKYKPQVLPTWSSDGDPLVAFHWKW